MSKLIEVSDKTAAVLFIILNLFCVSLGMGIPIFCILFGFPAGWFIARRVIADLASLETGEIKAESIELLYHRILKLSCWTSGFTFLLMIVIWARIIPMLFDPAADIQNFGHPFILYDPKLSLVAWLVLMILISPFLQLLTTIFASFITLTANKFKVSTS